MILSHENHLIFLKTVKTAGTSFEIALSKFCGSRDVITPLKKSDEDLRTGMGFRGTQNNKKSIVEILSQRKRADLQALKEKSWPKHFRNHATAEEIRSHVGRRVWEKYTKITIVRNPFDQIVSQYYHKKAGNAQFPEFEMWLVQNLNLLVRNQNIYMIENEFVADCVLRHETILDDLVGLESSMPKLGGISEIFSGINAKGQYRPKTGATVEDVFGANDDLKGLVRCICRQDLERFNYHYPGESRGTRLIDIATRPHGGL